MNPLVEVSIISSVPPTIAALWAVALGMLNRRKLLDVGTKVDGQQTALNEALAVRTTESAQRGGQLMERSAE